MITNKKILTGIIITTSTLLFGCVSIHGESKNSLVPKITLKDLDNPEKLQLQIDDSVTADESKSDVIKTTDQKFWWPLVEGPVISPFGHKRGKKRHAGIDLKGFRGQAVKSSGNGVVVFAGVKRGYGRVAIVDHGGMKTLYAHCQKLFVKKDQKIVAGEMLGTVGSSGNAHGTHLHFELRDKNDKAIDPIPHLMKTAAGMDILLSKN